MLKSIFLCLILLVFVEKGLGQEVNNYQEAIALSKKNNKEIFICFGAEWCSYCKKIENVFKSEEVSKELDNFIFLKINIDDHKELSKKYSVKTIPDYMLINKEEQIVKRHTGYKSKEEFIEWLK